MPDDAGVNQQDQTQLPPRNRGRRVEPHGKTKAEKRTDDLLKKLRNHVELWYEETTGHKYKDYNWLTSYEPFHVWRFDYAESIAKINEKKSIWLVWDGAEVRSYDRFEEMFLYVLHQKRVHDSQTKLQYWTSPLAVSAILAVILTGVLSYLSIMKIETPPQLWTIFTAVIAFYFGRQASTKTKVEAD
jgi:hypothetical protein